MSSGRRRNGKLFACENCRKQKIRCDHTRPACGRCSRKGIADQCIYDPAPLTRRDTPSSWKTPSLPLASPLQTHTPLQVAEDSIAVPASIVGASKTPGFLGPTSFSDVLSSKDTSVWKDDLAKVVNQSLRNPLFTYALPGEKISHGAGILSLLRDFKHIKATIHQYTYAGTTSILPWAILERAIDSLHKTMEEFSTETQRKVLASKIFAQTCIPMVVDETTTPDNFHLLFTAEALRWEFLGVVFTYLAMGSLLNVSEAGKTERVQYIRELTNASNFCVSCCDQPESLNDPLVWLLHSNCILLTFQYGDASHLAWRRTSHLADTIFAMGLHQDPSNQPKLPFFISELRRKAFANAYSSDKALSTFFGRPPRISTRYSSCRHPYDLSDEDLLAPAEVRSLAISKLNNGWNPDGIIYRQTWGRLKMLLNGVREEVLELSLGPPAVGDDQRTKALVVLNRLRSTWEGIPEFLRYDDNCWRSGLPASACFSLLYYFMGHTYSEFLLHRIIARHFDKNQNLSAVTNMFEVAQKLLSLVLVISKNRDRITGLSRDFSWVSIFYGLPSAALLSIELLRQQQSQQPNEGSQVYLPRAEIIRNISVFVSSLEWVARPEDGNYGLCQGARNTLEKILDSILNFNPVALPTPAMQTAPTDPLSWVEEYFGDGWMASGPFVDSLAPTDTQNWELDGNWPFDF